MRHALKRTIGAALAALFVWPIVDLAYRITCGDLQHWVRMRDRASYAWPGGGDVL